VLAADVRWQWRDLGVGDRVDQRGPACGERALPGRADLLGRVDADGLHADLGGEGGVVERRQALAGLELGVAGEDALLPGDRLRSPLLSTSTTSRVSCSLQRSA
jgi:hypothetical protein